MSNNKLYFISKDICHEEEIELVLKNYKIFYKLKDALDELNTLYNTNSPVESYRFCVRTLGQKDNKYIQTHETYYHQKGYS